jgi:hypothetical protein
MKLRILQDFSYSHNGYALMPYTAGTEVDTDDAEFVRVATTDGRAGVPNEKAEKQIANKARKAAPENKSH